MRDNSFERATSKGRLEIQDKSSFKMRVSNQVPSNYPKGNNYKVSNPKYLKERRGNSPCDKPTCAKSGKKHKVKWLVGTRILIC